MEGVRNQVEGGKNSLKSRLSAQNETDRNESHPFDNAISLYPLGK